MMRNIYGITFNCWYAGKEAMDPKTYVAYNGGNEVLMNIMYNIGHMYTAIMNLFT